MADPPGLLLPATRGTRHHTLLFRLMITVEVVTDIDSYYPTKESAWILGL
jgi:hypothetical protein